MKKNHSSQIPRNIVVLDVIPRKTTKSISGNVSKYEFLASYMLRFRIEDGKATRNQEIANYGSNGTMFDLLSSAKTNETTWVFGHDLGKQLTWLGFWDCFMSGALTFGPVTKGQRPEVVTGDKPYKGRIVTKSPPFFIYCLGEFGKFRFIDVRNYVDCKLSELVEPLGWNVLDDFDMNLKYSEAEAFAEVRAKALKHWLTEMLVRWSDDDMGVFQPTSAMLALTSFRHLVPTQENRDVIMYDHQAKSIRWHQLEKESYYGGLVRPFFVGRIVGNEIGTQMMELGRKDDNRPMISGPVYHVDVNALYPFVMRENTFPVRRLNRECEPRIKDVASRMLFHGAVACVEIKDWANPYIKRMDGFCYQATGHYWTSLCGPELQSALDNGSVHNISEVQYYQMGTPFTNWVDRWWKRRKESKSLGRLADVAYCKMIMNSLSGKFAQCGERWVDRENEPAIQDFGERVEIDMDTGLVREFRYIARHVQEKVDEGYPSYYFPALSAYITAYGREFMGAVRRKLPKSSVLYQATDSLILTEDGFRALSDSFGIDEDDIGAFKLVGRYDEGEILNANHYRLGERWTRAGSWGCARRTGDGTYECVAWDSVDTILKRTPEASVREFIFPLSGASSFNRGRIDPNGFVSPVCLAYDTITQDLNLDLGDDD